MREYITATTHLSHSDSVNYDTAERIACNPMGRERPTLAKVQLDTLAAALHSPTLPNAACKGRTELFDAPEHLRSDDDSRRYAIASAEQLCSCCPELPACKRWLASLPVTERPRRIVVAGTWQP